MKNKRIIAWILAGVMILSLFTGLALQLVIFFGG